MFPHHPIMKTKQNEKTLPFQKGKKKNYIAYLLLE